MHHISRRIVILIATLTFAMGIPLGIVIAGHQFNDVPNSNPFHGDIDAIADAGVTAGCGGGNYCPQANVTREQMAAFMNRLGALGPGKTPVVNADRLDGNDSPDLALAGLRARGSDGEVFQWFNHAGGKPTINKTGTGVYHVTIPGRNLNVNLNFVGTASVVGGPGFATVGSASGNVIVSTFDETGTASDESFMLTLIDASTGD